MTKVDNMNKVYLVYKYRTWMGNEKLLGVFESRKLCEEFLKGRFGEENMYTGVEIQEWTVNAPDSGVFV